MAYNGNELVRAAQSAEEVDKTTENAWANPITYASQIYCNLINTPTGDVLEVTGQLSQINPGPETKLKYLFVLYEDNIEFEGEICQHITRAIEPSATGSSIRVSGDKVASVNKQFSVDTLDKVENAGSLFIVFDADTNEVYTYSHCTLRSPHITRGIGGKHTPDRPIVLEFDKDIDPSTFSNDSVLCVSSIGRPIKGDYSVSGNICTFTPEKSFKEGSEYAFYLKGSLDGIKSISGNEMDDNYTCHFTAEETEQAELVIDTESLNIEKLTESVEKRIKLTNNGNADLIGNVSTDETWLTVIPQEFTIKPGETIDVMITITPNGLDKGTYNYSVNISSNGGNSTIPVTFEYSPITATLFIEPDQIDFGEVTIGESKTLEFKLSADSSVSGAICANKDWIMLGTPSFEFASGTVEVTITPNELGELSGEISIESNGGNFTIPVIVSCIEKASIQIESELQSPTTETQIELLVKMTPANKRFNLYHNDELIEENRSTAANGEMRLYIDLVPGYNTFKVESIDTEEIVMSDITIIRQLILKLWIDKTDFMINDQTVQLDVAPTVFSPPLPKELENNTYMPIRAVAEALGAEVDWVGTEKKVTLTQKRSDGSQIYIEMWINKRMAKVNGVETTLNDNGTLYPAIISGRTMLPLRFVANNLGAKVGWDGAERKITLTFPN